MNALSIDTLIHARWIIPVEPRGLVLEDHSLAIREGRIHDILPTETARERYTAGETVERPDHALIPGLVNAHTHAAMTLLRGLADDLPLMTWLQEHMWPAERKWVSEAFVYDGTQHALAEMLRGGITCFNDMYFYPEVTAQAAAACGMRATVGLIVIDFPSAWAGDADEYLSKGLALHDEYRGDPLIRTAFAPHAPYSVSDDPLQRIRTLAEELQIPIHMHVHETRDEIHQGLEGHGVRPLARLHRLGLVSPALIGVHMVHLEEDELAAYAEAGAQVVHCPESNLKLASGVSPVPRLLQAGINVALGTDGAASNNDLDLFSEMRTAALLAKTVADDASALPAEEALRMATWNGARALGLEQETGSLEVGKSADITAVDFGGIDCQPVYHPISQLVYATGRDKVTDVWVAGRRLLRERALTTLDAEEIITRTQQWAQQIRTADGDRGVR